MLDSKTQFLFEVELFVALGSVFAAAIIFFVGEWLIAKWRKRRSQCVKGALDD